MTLRLSGTVASAFFNYHSFIYERRWEQYENKKNKLLFKPALNKQMR